MNFLKRKERTTNPSTPHPWEKRVEPEEPEVEVVVQEKTIQESLSELGVILKKEHYEFEELSSVNMLKELGFSQTPSVRITDRITSRVSLLRQHALDYPGFKFITHEEWKQIHDKYGLVLGKPREYIKEIPTEHIERIFKFKESVKDKVFRTVTFYHLQFPTNDRPACVDYFDSEKEARKRVEETSGEMNVSCSMESGLFLKIAAAPSHFDLQKKKVNTEGIIEPDDPIALHEVKGGYIVITAWDKEAEIPEIINPFNN